MSYQNPHFLISKSLEKLKLSLYTSLEKLKPSLYTKLKLQQLEYHIISHKIQLFIYIYISLKL